MIADKPTPEACETCGLIAWINNGDCDDLCAFCNMRDERDEYARQLAEVTRERDAAKQAASIQGEELRKLRDMLTKSRADLAALREALNFYANPGDYKLPFVGEKLYFDCGRVARKALTAEHTPAEETKP